MSFWQWHVKLSLGWFTIWYAGAGFCVDTSDVTKAAANLLGRGSISYVYGGHQFSNEASCQKCNECVQVGKSYKLCQACLQCGLDCSHFVQRVFHDVGLVIPYLTTNTMLNLTAASLQRKYHLVDLRLRTDLMQPGDLVVYKGHVGMVEKIHNDQQVDMIHATSGREIKGDSGQGVQRARRIDVLNFHGPLKRILRHKALHLPSKRMRPLDKRRAVR